VETTSDVPEPLDLATLEPAIAQLVCYADESIYPADTCADEFAQDICLNTCITFSKRCTSDPTPPCSTLAWLATCEDNMKAPPGPNDCRRQRCEAAYPALDGAEVGTYCKSIGKTFTDWESCVTYQPFTCTKANVCNAWCDGRAKYCNDPCAAGVRQDCQTWTSVAETVADPAQCARFICNGWRSGSEYMGICSN
jgi:hypothetical protein